MKKSPTALFILISFFALFAMDQVHLVNNNFTNILPLELESFIIALALVGNEKDSPREQYKSLKKELPNIMLVNKYCKTLAAKASFLVCRDIVKKLSAYDKLLLLNAVQYDIYPYFKRYFTARTLNELKLETQYIFLARSIAFNALSITEYLLKSNINPNICAGSYKTMPIFVTVEKNNYKAAQLLLKHGAQLNVIDIKGKTPLHYAVSWFRHHKNYAMIEFLLQHGADMHKKDNEGNSAYTDMQRFQDQGLIGLFNHYDQRIYCSMV